MNHTQAKAHAAELGISKDTARQFGSLSKTQTWLDAIAAEASEQAVANEAKSQTQATLVFELEMAEEQSNPVLLLPIQAGDEPIPSSTVKAYSDASNDPWTEESVELDITKVENNPPQEAVSSASAPLIYPVLFLSIAIWSICHLLLGGALLFLTGCHLLCKLIHRLHAEPIASNSVVLSPDLKPSLET